jgi:RNA polymerase sporulation-specific sigma factor
MNLNKEITDPTRWRAYIIKIANTFNQNEEITKDLVQEGLIGVWQASLSYNGNTDKEWVNYMTTVIKNNMKTFLAKYSNTIRTPKALIGQDNLLKVVSTNTPINENGDILEHFIGEEASEEENDYSSLKTALMSLKDKERILIEMYYGINTDNPPMNYREIGEAMGTTRQNIEEKIKKALLKLKQNENIKTNH